MRVLDLYCGAGGAGMGYALAWPDAEIVGVDLRPQPNYPFRFVQADVLHLDPAWLATFDVVHASPPCQAHTTMSARWRGRGTVADERVDLLPPTRALLRQAGVHYVIENVAGASRQMHHPITLSGDRFGLQVVRPRLFETSFPVDARRRPPVQPIADAIGVYGQGPHGQVLWTRKDGTVQRRARSLAEGQAAMGGITWMNWRELCESIPPAYTRWIAEQFTAWQSATLLPDP
jgi:DNA (cytosine-5)-methyltransferase 1